MNKSWRERSALVSLAAVSLVFGIYFAKVFGLIRQGLLEAGAVLFLMIGAVVVLVVIEVVFHILISIPAGQPPRDERDKLITAKAGRNSGVVLGVGVVLTMAAILNSELLSGANQTAGELTPMVISQILVLLLVIAQAVEYLGQLYYYRRGI